MRRRKIRKFAYRQSDRQTSKQTQNISNTEATLILCGYSGERANIEVEKKSDIFKVPTLINPAVSRLQDESFGFGSDDSFDEHLSQIPIEEERQDMTDVSMSPVLKKRRTSIHSHKTKMKRSGTYC